MNEILSIRIMKRADKGLGGEWLTLPATEEQLKAVLSKIGFSEAGKTDLFISDFRTSLTVLDNAPLVTNADLNELNYLAARLTGLAPTQLEKLEAVGESHYRLDGISRMIDYTFNTDYYVLTTSVSSAEELGWFYLYKSGEIYMPEEWKSGIDAGALGRHIYGLEKGTITSHGYLNLSGDEWEVHYRAGEIPAEYMIFKPENYLATAEMSEEGNYNMIDGIINNTPPKPSILDQLRPQQEDTDARPAPDTDRHIDDNEL